MKFFWGLIAFIVMFSLLVLYSATKEAEKVAEYEQKCKVIGGAVVKWTTDGPPSARATNRNCIDPTIILEVK